MKRTDKKGFTIVELVIVIAVIAILAAVLIPNISKLVRKANESSDLSLVRNLNTALTVENKDYATAHEAFEAVKDAGYDLTKIEAKADTNKILYDSENQCFAYLKDGKLEYYPNTYKTKLTPNDYYKLWSIETVAKDSYTYSVYWNGENDATVTVKGVGFDAGSKTTKSVTYTGASEARSVVIRTNGGTLTINAANDEVDRHGKCDLLDVQAVKATSLHEYGTSNMVSIKSGRIIFETVDSANTVAFVEGNGAILAVVDKVEMPTVKRASDVTSFVMQTVSPTGDVATRSTVSISDGAVTVTTENGATTPANIKAEAIKESVKAEATKDNVKTEFLPVDVKTPEEFNKALGSTSKVIRLQNNLIFTNVIKVNRDVTIDGNGYEIKNSDNRVIRITGPSLNIVFRNLNVTSTSSAPNDKRGISFDNASSKCKVVIDGCKVFASYYAVNICPGVQNIELSIKNSAISGWSAINSYSNNSTFTIENSVLEGVNDKTQSSWNNFATIVFDGNGLLDEGVIPGQYGTGNTLKLIRSTVKVSSANSNVQCWFSIQYGAKDNQLIIDGQTMVSDGTANRLDFYTLLAYVKKNNSNYNVNSKLIINGTETSLVTNEENN